MKTQNKILIVLALSLLAVVLSGYIKRDLPGPTSCDGPFPCYRLIEHAGWPLPFMRYDGVFSPVAAHYSGILFSSTEWLWLPYFLDWWFYFATIVVLSIVGNKIRMSREARAEVPLRDLKISSENHLNDNL